MVFIDPNRDDEGNRIPDVIDGGSIEESPAKRKYRVFIASNLTWDASTILSLYALRWSIETGYRDMSQNLGLHGCQWRELDGQQCFVALTFTCYLLLLWAKKNGLLDQYGVHLETVGDVKHAFIHYCQDEFSRGLHDIREQCRTCNVSKWIERHVFIGNG
ncbi:MAG: transposase [Promethearchaeota archaeon]